MLQRKRIAALAQLRQRVGQERRARVVGARQRPQVETELRLFLRGREEIRDLRRMAGVELPGQADITRRHRTRALARLGAQFLARRRGTLEGDDILQRQAVVLGMVARALQQIEKSEPGERRNLGVIVVGDAVLEHETGMGGLPIGVQKRRVLEHCA